MLHKNKWIALFLSLLLLLSFSGCGNSQSAEQSYTFEIPKNYAYAVKVTINPKVELYIDSNNKILAVEYLNNDAKEAFSESSITGLTLNDGLKQIIEAAIVKEYLKDGKNVTIEVGNIKDISVDATEILRTAKETVEYTLTEKAITASVITKDLNAENEMSSNSPETQDNNPLVSVPPESTPADSSEPNIEAAKTDCSRCGGSGECQGCHGGKDACPACSGSGYETCPMCDANGLDHGQTCTTCGGSHRYICTHCGGTGTAKDCPECGGSFKCPTCGGTGKQQ